MTSIFLSSFLTILVATTFAAVTSSATISITNNCGFRVWATGNPVGGSKKLNNGQTWTVDVPAGTSGRFWGRPGSCTFNAKTGHYDCDTADLLASELANKLSGPCICKFNVTTGHYDCPTNCAGEINSKLSGVCICKFNVTTGRYDCPTNCAANELTTSKLSGDPPAMTTLAEYTISGGGSGGHDYYDISLVNGYNLPMAFSCETGDGIVCKNSKCPAAYQSSSDSSKTHACNANSNYRVMFCPS